MDRESVITHLQIIHTWAEFARERDLQFFTAKHLEDIAQWADDAINLLKEQEVIEQISDAIHETAKQFRQTIVRCNHCKHYRKSTCSAGAGMAFPTPGDWFCADGERVVK